MKNRLAIFRSLLTGTVNNVTLYKNCVTHTVVKKTYFVIKSNYNKKLVYESSYDKNRHFSIKKNFLN